MFGDNRLPTLVQYDPGHRYFEVDNSTLVFTADGAVPLIRYHTAVTEALEQPGIAEWTTGRFVIRTPEDADGDRLLDITVELAPAADGGGRETAVAETIRTELVQLNSEVFRPPRKPRGADGAHRCDRKSRAWLRWEG